MSILKLTFSNRMSNYAEHFMKILWICVLWICERRNNYLQKYRNNRKKYLCYIENVEIKI